MDNENDILLLKKQQEINEYNQKYATHTTVLCWATAGIIIGLTSATIISATSGLSKSSQTLLFLTNLLVAVILLKINHDLRKQNNAFITKKLNEELQWMGDSE